VLGPAALAVPPKPDKGKQVRAPKAPKVVPAVVGPLTAAQARAIPAAAVVPPAPGAVMTEPYGEAQMPRWRRPSLRTARYASPRIAAAPIAALIFPGGAASGLERRRVRYDLVALTDIPDEIRGAQVGQLQVNDEVEITTRQGAWVKVRTPVGAEGWIHRTTLQSTDEDSKPVEADVPRIVNQPVVKPPPPPDSIQADVAMGAFAAAARARTIEVAQTAAAVSDPAEPVKPARRPRSRRPATPQPPEPARTPRTPKTPRS
jgi:hypothetical protein